MRKIYNLIMLALALKTFLPHPPQITLNNLTKPGYPAGK
jgi:hypothetical protein